MRHLDDAIRRACGGSAEAYVRARDLVDLQLIFSRSEVDLSVLRRTCERLFAYRKAQAWPPKVSERTGWDELCSVQAEGLPVAQTVGEATDWATRSSTESSRRVKPAIYVNLLFLEYWHALLRGSRKMACA